MGYYTQYSLTIKNVKTEYEIENFINCFNNYFKNDIENFFEYLFYYDHYRDSDDAVHFESKNEAKWYCAEEDMMEISKLFPEYIFELHGEGEDFPDLWNCYFKNGVEEFCKGNLIYDQPKNIKW